MSTKKVQRVALAEQKVEPQTRSLQIEAAMAQSTKPSKEVTAFSLLHLLDKFRTVNCQKIKREIESSDTFKANRGFVAQNQGI